MLDGRGGRRDQKIAGHPREASGAINECLNTSSTCGRDVPSGS
jgi:hypothetical protein